MKCPIDTTVDLVMSERLGIEIDYCPTCRGVWLDRGELDKLIDREAARFDDDRGRHDDDDDDRNTRGRGPDRPSRRRGSFLGELFEFGG